MVDNCFLVQPAPVPHWKAAILPTRPRSSIDAGFTPASTNTDFTSSRQWQVSRSRG
jgi:hypothetical protein